MTEFKPGDKVRVEGGPGVNKEYNGKLGTVVEVRGGDWASGFILPGHTKVRLFNDTVGPMNFPNDTIRLHPFDVGDYVNVNAPYAKPGVITEINSYEGTRMYRVGNSSIWQFERELSLASDEPEDEWLPKQGDYFTFSSKPLYCSSDGPNTIGYKLADNTRGGERWILSDAGTFTPADPPEPEWRRGYIVEDGKGIIWARMTNVWVNYSGRHLGDADMERPLKIIGKPVDES